MMRVRLKADGRLVEILPDGSEAALLQAAGLSWGDVVKINVYVKDITKYQEFNAIYMDAIPAPRPARTFIAVAGLPANGQVEIEGIAIKRK